MSDNRTVILEDGYEYEVIESRDKRGRRGLIILIAVLLVVVGALGYLAVASSGSMGDPADEETTAGIQWIRSIYGYGSAQSEMMRRPTDTAPGPNGSTWVVDGQNARLMRIAPDGQSPQVISIPRGTGKGQASALQGIDTDADGNVFVTDFIGSKVLKFSPAGELILEWPVPDANGVDVQGDTVVITSSSGYATFDLQGVQRAIVGRERGTDEDLFDMPRDAVIDERGNIYVSDSLNKRVKAYDRNGNMLWVTDGEHKDIIDPETGLVDRFVPASSEESGSVHALQLPQGITLDGAGRLVLVDPFDFSLWVLSPENGEFVAHYGAFGELDGQFVYPSGVSYDPSRDWFSVADTNNDRAQVVRIPGSGGTALDRLLGAINFPLWLCLVPLGALMLALLLLVVARRRRRRDEALEQAEPSV